MRRHSVCGACLRARSERREDEPRRSITVVERVDEMRCWCAVTALVDDGDVDPTITSDVKMFWKVAERADRAVRSVCPGSAANDQRDNRRGDDPELEFNLLC